MVGMGSSESPAVAGTFQRPWLPAELLVSVQYLQQKQSLQLARAVHAASVAAALHYSRTAACSTTLKSSSPAHSAISECK